MVKKSAIKYAKSQMLNADMALKEVEDRIDPDSQFDVGITLQNINIIVDCQRFIEIYTKSMFKLVGVNPPERHKMDFDNDRTQGFLGADFPEEFESKDNLPRVVFLTHFWDEFYTEAKYGYPEQDLRPSDLFDLDDARRAIDHAKFVQETGKELLDAIQEEHKEDL